MNKDEAMRLAIDISSKPMPWNGEYTFRSKKELLAFSNACEKIGMKRAAEKAYQRGREDEAYDRN